MNDWGLGVSLILLINQLFKNGGVRVQRDLSLLKHSVYRLKYLSILVKWILSRQMILLIGWVLFINIRTLFFRSELFARFLPRPVLWRLIIVVSFKSFGRVLLLHIRLGLNRDEFLIGVILHLVGGSCTSRWLRVCRLFVLNSAISVGVRCVIVIILVVGFQLGVKVANTLWRGLFLFVQRGLLSFVCLFRLKLGAVSLGMAGLWL